MADPTQAGGGDRPSEEEMQQYLEQLRAADPTEIVAQAFNMLATGAQVKIGRPDGRTLIDTLDAIANSVRSRLPDDVVDQMQQGVSQLQQMQVQAEQEDQGAAAEGQDATAGTSQPGGGQPQPGSPQGGQQQGDQQQGDQRMTSRLWVPGQGSSGT